MPIARRRSSMPSRLAAAAMSIVAVVAPVRAEEVGAASAVNLKSIRTPPGQPPRIIEIGAQIVRNEKIETSTSGSVQLLFIDKTALSIGPNSRIVIDKFVFNPVTTEGEVALSVTKGVLRVVGGMATHSGGGTITTPVATIGIRGGIVTVSHSQAKGTQAILGYGVLTVTAGCEVAARAPSGCAPQTVTVRRPGFMVQVAGSGGAPTEPVRATAADIGETNKLLTSKVGQTGGASKIPSDPLAVKYNVGTPNSTAAPGVTVQNAPRGGNLPGAVASAGQLVRQGVQNAAGLATARAIPTPTPTPTPTPMPTPTPTPAAVAAYAIVTNGPYGTSAGASPAPYLTASYAGVGKFTVSPILGYQGGGLDADGSPNVTSRQFQAGLRLTGQGAAQTSTLFVMTSEIARAPTLGVTQAGGTDAVSYQPQRDAAGEHLGVAVGSATPTSALNSVPISASGAPSGSYALYNSIINLNTGVVTSSSQDGYSFNPIATATPNPVAVNHPSLTLQGYVGGLMQSTYKIPANSSITGYVPNPYIVTNATGNPGDVSIYLPGESSGMGAVFNVVGVNPPKSGYNSASYQFGGYFPTDPANTAGRNTARGAYVDPADFAARGAAIFDNGANIPTSSRNGQTLSGSGDAVDSLLVTAGPVGANTSAFLSSISSASVAPCACEFTQWGFWSSVTGQTAANGAARYFDNAPIPMLWVAGVPTSAANIPTTGTATYTGHAIADISNNSAQYLAAGTFSNTVNFGTRTGAVTIGGLDGANYVGTIGLTPSSALFAGNLTGSVGGRAAALNGSFFQGGATNATPLYGEMGGSLRITGPNYFGSGIFLGRKP